MTLPRHAIFDLDGTLVDSLPGIAWSAEAALTACGLPPMTADLRRLIGPPIRSILSAVSGLTEGSSLDRLEQAFRGSYDTDGWRRTVCYAGVPEMLADLQRGGIGLWLVTNKPALATGKILRHLEFDGFFQEVVCRDSRSPAYGSKAEALAGLIGRIGQPLRECVLIGDTGEDRDAATAAGIDCIIVAHGYGAKRRCELPDWDEIVACFNQSTALPR